MSRFIACCVLAWVGVAVATAAEPCLGAKGDIGRESALFDAEPAVLAAGRSPDAAPPVTPERLYRINLLPQDQVRFAAAPGRSTLHDGYAGVVLLNVAQPGAYRVSVDGPLWIDVVGDGALQSVRDFQALRGCEAPRKIVEFELTGTRRFVVQLSGSGRPTVRVAVTRVANAGS